MLPAGVGARSARWLFSEHVLEERAPEWPEFRSADVRALHAELTELWAREYASLRGANEGVTEERLIRPILRALGHAYTLFPTIPGARTRPDYLLYASESDRQAAEMGPAASIAERATAVADAKRLALPLDRRWEEGDPVAQVRSYIYHSGVPFGILTNGQTWRLYARDAALVERACHEVDLEVLLHTGTVDDLRYFVSFFGAQAFVESTDGRSFLQRALDDSALHAVDISDRLERSVFAAVPPIAEGLLGDDDRSRASLDAAFGNALVFLYRVLFCLFAEARGLLPVSNSDYQRYSVAQQRREIARALDTGRFLSTTHDGFYSELRALFRMIHGGEAALGVTEYDGQLFDAEPHRMLEERSVPDALLAGALDGLYRTDRNFVDYRDLSVRTLGTVYERLLAWQLVEADDGHLELEESPLRHETGSYFTPEPVVDAIVEGTLDPLVRRVSETVRDASDDEVVEAFLALRVIDPAMGSGHFLVGAVEFLAQAIATDPSYDGNLSLGDLRRLIAERCLYGVDLNPLAVELARLSLWLVTAREGEPLSFLGNLRVGNSLVGTDSETLLEPGTNLLEDHLAAAARDLLRQTSELHQRVTHTGADAREKKRLAAEIEALRLPLEVFADRSLEALDPPDRRPYLHWPLEFPEVFVDEHGRQRSDAGFDAVIGNPPYIRVQDIGRSMADYCRRRYVTASGSFDAYVVFLERGIQVLKLDGRLGFIVPNKLFKLDYGARLRRIFAERGLVDEIVDFGASQVFAEATNYTCLLFLDAGGRDELSYRRVRGSRGEVLEQLALPHSGPVQRFARTALSDEPWVLVPPEEAALLEVARSGSARLEEVVESIFTGLQTNADDIYVLENRGRRSDRSVVFSRASGLELEIEPDLLHPLASGADVGRYTFRALTKVLLFPYVPGDDGMRLVTTEELSRLPLTAEYLLSHESRLRARERHRMDHDRWYAYVYPKSLGAHHSPKVGIPRLCARLRAAADKEGVVYLDNVDVNGLRVESSASNRLVALLNTRLLDWIFRRCSVPFQNEYWSANKQFIAGLPIRLPSSPDAVELEALGARLHDLAASVATERGSFLHWLAETIGVSRATLARRRFLASWDSATAGEVVRALAAAPGHDPDPRERVVRELIEREHRAAVDRIVPLLLELQRAETEADEFAFELYGIPSGMRALVDGEYPA